MSPRTLLAFALALLLVGCASRGATPGSGRHLAPGDLLILDADSGAPVLGGAERLGQLFVARLRADGSYAPLELYAEDERWIEPLELLVTPQGDVLVLESTWSVATAESQASSPADTAAPASSGALFCVQPGGQRPTRLLSSPPEWRRPVALAQHSDGRLFVSDRDANPLDLDQATGCIWVFDDARAEGAPSVAAAGPQLVTPGPMAFDDQGQLLVMDADANPLQLELPGGRKNTPGVLYALVDGALEMRVMPRQTISPIGLIRTDAGRLIVVDANFGWGPRIRGDGALFAVNGSDFELLLDSVLLGRPGALLDPVDGDALADGRLVIADGNVDPLGLGPDDTGKGVHGTGPGAVLIVDLDALSLETLIADARFVSPMCVRRVR